MQKLLQNIVPVLVGKRGRKHSIDNFVFRLHYRITTAALLAAAVLTSSYHYLDSSGSAIQCMVGKRYSKIVTQHCWVSSTYSLPEVWESGVYPGVGYGSGGRVYHAYYQWVPYYLLMLALAFYLPHLVWKTLEGGRSTLLLQEDQDAMEEEEDDVREPGETRTGVRWEQVERIAEYLERRTRLGIGGGYEDMWLLFCEFANLAVVVAALVLTNVFLGGEFWQFGTEAIQWQWQEEQERLDPLSRVFPKMTKCDFHMYGPSGTLQNVDALCVLGVNALNEKIFLVLWFWLLFLLIGNFCQLLVRSALLLYPSWRIFFLRLSLWPDMPSIATETSTLENLTVSLPYNDWLVLELLSHILPERQWVALIHSTNDRLNGWQREHSVKLIHLIQKFSNVINL